MKIKQSMQMKKEIEPPNKLITTATSNLTNKYEKNKSEQQTEQPTTRNQRNLHRIVPSVVWGLAI